MTDRVRAFIFDNKKKFLVLTRRIDGVDTLVLPGGGVEGKETYRATLNREMHEEIGIGVNSLIQLPIQSFSKFAPGYGLLKFKYYSIKPGAVDLIENLEPTKHIAIEWLTIYEWLEKVKRGYEPGVLVEEAYKHALRIKCVLRNTI